MNLAKFTIALLIGITTLGCFGQNVTGVKGVPSNLDRYYIEYEVVGLETPSEDILADINLLQYEDLRLQHENVEVNDIATGFTLILYSVETCLANWRGDSRKIEDHTVK